MHGRIHWNLLRSWWGSSGLTKSGGLTKDPKIEGKIDNQKEGNGDINKKVQTIYIRSCSSRNAITEQVRVIP